MAIVEMVVSAMFKEVLEKLVSEGVKQFTKLISRGKSSKDKIKIEEWKDELEMIQAVLIDAEHKQCDEQHGAAIRLWLENLQDLAFDLEDLLDDFALEALKMNDDVDAHHFKKNARGFLPASFHNMVGNILACGCGSTRQIGYSGPDFSSRIDEISNALNSIKSRVPTLGLVSNNLRLPTYAIEELRKTRQTSSLGEPHVYGRNDRKEDIICQLLEDNPTYENYVVIPIVGMGGIGKTTLAQYVYRDEKVKAHFDLKAWVCVSDVFDVKRITKDIINSATPGNFDCNNLNEAQQKLQQVVKDKKILVVLDDIWSEEYEEWNQLQIPFLGAARGSRVIVTTRKEVTATVMNNQHYPDTIHLERLPGEYCWSIFQQHVNTVYPDLAARRDDIIRKCDGLPLAAKTLGGLLRKTVEKSQRQRIIDSNIWSKTCGILPVLRLSYHYLPSHLKCLFAYCSVFPKDCVFEEMDIIQLWMAQGLLSDNTNERIEDIGYDYFNDLVSRSLFEKNPANEGTFIMHDLIHDVAQFAAGNLCNVMDGTDTHTDFRRTRHLFITRHVQTLGNQIMASQLRTFLGQYGLKINYFDFFTKIRHVRTLSLCSLEIETLPECIGDLKHLHYLSLKFARIKKLPPSIGNLLNLQTLCLNGCYQLEKFPCIESLRKLRHLYICFTFSLKEMPLGIEKLTNLQTLDKFVLAVGGGSRVRELGKLHQLCGRSIIVSGLENVIEVNDAEEAHLSKNENLAELYLNWGTCPDMVDDKTRTYVVEKLRPHTSIKECKLFGYMGSKFPSWLGDPSFINMVDIKLKNCQKSVCLPLLGNLPSLKSLLIEYMNGIKEVGVEFYGNCLTPFPSLKTLSVLSVKSWEKWVHPSLDNNKAFPILEELSLNNCPSLQGELPPHLPYLKRLKINGVQQLQSLELKTSTSHLEEVIVSGCKSMGSIGQIPLTLKLLEIADCEKLEYVEFDEQPTNLFPGSDDEKDLQSEEIEGVSPKATLELPFLTKLSIQRCPNLISLQQSLLLPALHNLLLLNCENMEWLPVGLHNITSLQKLRINECPKIHSLAEVGLPRNLTSLAIEEVNISQAIQIIECIPCPHLSFPSSLSNLEINGFQNLKTISFNCSTFPNLTSLSIRDCPRLESLLNNFASLTRLVIVNCPELHNIPEGGLLTNLKEIRIRGTKIDKPIKEWGFHLFTSLSALVLINVGSCVDTLESISYPDFPSSLNILKIEGFQNLKTICCSTLPNLFRMNIRNCPKLESFGDNGLPPRIYGVYIKECDMIEQQLTSDPNGRIETENGRFSLPLSGSQPSSAQTNIEYSSLLIGDKHYCSTLLELQKVCPRSDIHPKINVITVCKTIRSLAECFGCAAVVPKEACQS